MVRTKDLLRVHIHPYKIGTDSLLTGFLFGSDCLKYHWIPLVLHVLIHTKFKIGFHGRKPIGSNFKLMWMSLCNRITDTDCSKIPKRGILREDARTVTCCFFHVSEYSGVSPSWLNVTITCTTPFHSFQKLQSLTCALECRVTSILWKATYAVDPQRKSSWIVMIRREKTCRSNFC